MLDDAYLALADPQTRDVLAALPVIDLDRDLAQVRREAERVVPPAPPHVRPAVVQSDVLLPDGLRVRRYEGLDRPRPSGAVVWVHGGGMVMGSIDGSDDLCRHLASTYRVLVVSVDYRLAPETPAPGAVEDVWSALDWTASSAAELGLDPALLVVAGGSSGGGLALGAAMLARDRGPALAGQVLAYPMLDDRCAEPSAKQVTYARTWHRAANRAAWALYLGGLDSPPLHVAPGRAQVADLVGLPPTHLDVGTLDVFRDEVVGFAARLAQAGVPVQLLLTPGAWHGSEQHCPSAETSLLILAARDRAFRALFQRTPS